MKTRRPIARLLCIAMMLALLTVGWAQAGPLDLPSTPTATLNVTVDGTPLVVTNYKVVYVANPVEVAQTAAPGYTYDYQTMNIYVPSNASPSSPIILQDGNSGWNGNKVGTPVVPDGLCLTTASTTGTTACTQKTAMELKAGYVIVSFGIRSRSGGMLDTDGNYVSHAPAQLVDTKAAIRYLRYNAAAITGSTDRMIITGTSGGGAQGVAAAASGNSPDYYPDLYAIEAAGITYDAQTKTYSSTINDDLFGTVLYCPITDLDHADAAYDWTYGQTRIELGTYSTAQLTASDFLKANYVTYFNGLGLKDKNGNPLTAALSGSFPSGSFADAIKAAAEKGVEKGCREVGATQMAADINALTYKDSTWYSIDATTCSNATVDLDKWLYFVARNQTLKNPPAFDNLNTQLASSQNETNLSGTTAQPYSHFAEWSWDHNTGTVPGVGLNNTGLPWQQFILTDAGKAVLKQMKMINPMPYLTSDAANADSAPYWYYRHGMRDRDTSFPVPVALYYAVLNNSDVSNVNFNLAWLKPHQGDYDVPEAYEWVAEAVDNANTFDAIDTLIGDTVTHSFSGLPTGAGITYSSSNESVFKVVNGQAVVTQPAKMDAKVTLKVEVVSDKISLTGFNYGKVDVTRAFTFTVPALSKDQCKNGGWQHLFRTDGTAFKNQGDCIQYANTGK
jgi:hypothetical protein